MTLALRWSRLAYDSGVAIHMHEQTTQYNPSQAPEIRRICDLLAREIEIVLPEAGNKVWHAQSGLKPEGKFKAAAREDSSG